MVTYGPAGDRLRANRGATPRPRSSNSVTPACHPTSYTGTWGSPAPQGPTAGRAGSALNRPSVALGGVLDGRRGGPHRPALDGHGQHPQGPAEPPCPGQVPCPFRSSIGRVTSMPTWTHPEGVIGDVLASFFTWAAQQELESIRRRTKAGLEKARSERQDLGNAAEDDGLEGGNGKVLPEGRLELQADRDGVGGVQDHCG